jgi:hypothetical protein
VLLLVFGAFVNASAMTVPVIQWMNEWQARLGFASRAPIVAAFYFVGLFIPLALVCVLSRPRWRDPGITFSLTLVPLGFSMWIAHFWFHYLTAWSAIVPAFRIAWVASSNMQVPAWWPPVEILLLDAGLLLTLYLGWKIARRFTPWAILAVLLYAAGLWILFQPMQMRGMLMS